MTAKEYLNQARSLNIKIADNEETVKQLEKEKTALKATDYSKDKVQKSTSNDASYTNVVEKIMILQDTIRAETEQMIALKAEIRCKIRQMDNADEENVLYEFYINCMKLTGVGSISEKMCKSERWIIEIYNRAIKSFSKKYNFSS